MVSRDTPSIVSRDSTSSHAIRNKPNYESNSKVSAMDQHSGSEEKYNRNKVEKDMDMAVARLRQNMNLVVNRVGRLTPRYLDGIKVWHENSVKISARSLRLSSLTLTPCRSSHTIHQSYAKAIEQAIYGSRLNLAPKLQSDGSFLMSIPKLTLDTRRKLAKESGELCEVARAAIRNIRQAAQKSSRADLDDNLITKDDYKDNQKSIDNVSKTTGNWSTVSKLNLRLSCSTIEHTHTFSSLLSKIFYIPHVGGYHSYQGVPIHTLMPFPDGRKRQKVGSGAYDGTMPPGVQDGVQVCMGNVGVYPEGFPWETRKNPNHGRLVFEKEDTNVPLLNPIVEGASSPEAYWLSRVNVELSGTDPKVRIRTDQLAFNTFSDLGVVVAAGDQRKEKHHAKTQHVPQSPDPSTGESYFPQESSQDVTFTEIAHEAHPKDVDRSPKAKKQVEGRVNLPQMVSESEEKVDEYLSKIHLPRRRIAMSDQFLKGFTEQFRRKLGEVFKLNSKGNSINAGLKGGSTLRISQNKTIELYLIRVFNNHQARTTPQDAHVLQGKEMIFAWKDMSYSDEYTYHKRLVDWLFHQAFNPGGSILPVLGATKTIQGKDFGPVQIILSIYLSESLKSNKAFGTSNDIIRFYYENIHIIDLKGIRNLDENKILEKSLKRLIYQAIVSGLVIDNPIFRIEVLPANLET
ncbi:hypothetical protein H4Q26_012181 [Puccinia striiformis f. sp. tritici PST-130]|nr:hypothetical protein H4Q26_012181 [Puccinia striiformis f. sp. tritici PST-130]